MDAFLSPVEEELMLRSPEQVRPPATDESLSPLPAPSARSLLMTVMGEFGYHFDRPVWTATLLEAMRLLGVEDLATRQAIRRSSTAGWIEPQRHGREVAWTLAASGRAYAESGRRRAREFVEPPVAWDGQWFSLMVSMPDLPRAQRRRFYGALSWLTLGNLSPGLWVTPRVESAPAVRDLIDQFELTGSAIGVAGRLEVGLAGPEIVRRAWDLTELEASYQRLLDQYRDYVPRDDDELLVAYLTLRNLLQRFLRLDPMLPVELYPTWIGREAAALFGECWQSWTDPARERWLALERQTAPRR